jgi:hypothetical protein
MAATKMFTAIIIFKSTPLRGLSNLKLGLWWSTLPLVTPMQMKG